jgi:hypothetical protein
MEHSKHPHDEEEENKKPGHGGKDWPNPSDDNPPPQPPKP